ncbi:hypothetical protein U1Q18_016368 [Sarracenia purpurea var. burkii]
MRLKHSSQAEAGWLRKLVVLVLLLLVSGGEGKNGIQPPQREEGTPPEEPKQQLQHRLIRHSMDVFFSGKRKVPNASDPLHNR